MLRKRERCCGKEKQQADVETVTMHPSQWQIRVVEPCLFSFNGSRLQRLLQSRCSMCAGMELAVVRHHEIKSTTWNTHQLTSCMFLFSFQTDSITGHVSHWPRKKKRIKSPASGGLPISEIVSFAFQNQPNHINRIWPVKCSWWWWKRWWWWSQWGGWVWIVGDTLQERSQHRVGAHSISLCHI